jgi:hypothetical protein
MFECNGPPPDAFQRGPASYALLALLGVVIGVLDFLVTGDKQSGIPAPPGANEGQSSGPRAGHPPSISSTGQ